MLNPLAEPTDIVAKDLSTILYSFADVSADSGTISLTDSYADVEVCICMIPSNLRNSGFTGFYRNTTPVTRGRRPVITCMVV
jgi:hypothetical protein